ncbi:MAG: hypothetical protein MAG458_01397 [Nitrosopumilus sp.]|nr:hypothetical protein [Nitrosopumilus sp.]
MIKYLTLFSFVILFLLPPLVDAVEQELVITISDNGDATITHYLTPQSTVSAITIGTISEDISNILAVDENGIILDTTLQGNNLQITTLGATTVQLSYDSQIATNDSGIWKVTYTSDEQTTIVLPELTNIVSVNNIPLDMSDDMLVMPSGDISLSFTIREVVAQDFTVDVDGVTHTVQIMTGSQIDSFDYSSDVISFGVNDDVPVLVIIPNSLFSGNFDTALNEKSILHQNYFQDGQTSWLRIEPQNSGMITIKNSPIIPTTSSVSDQNNEDGGGCLIATATYGSELAPQVQQLRELRDNQLMQTVSGTAFMSTFNDIYYSFSPTIADMEREHPLFKEAVKIAITPMISTLSLMENANSESEVLSIGISVIALNLGMYLGVPAVVIIGIRKIK